MYKMLISILTLSGLLWLETSGQIGTSTLGKTVVGQGFIQPQWLGRSTLPACNRQSNCGQNPGCPIYTFIGKGDWRMPANWENGIMPPEILPSCFSIVIRPLGDAPCILPTPQFLLPGSSFSVEPGKHIIIPGNVSQKD